MYLNFELIVITMLLALGSLFWVADASGAPRDRLKYVGDDIVSFGRLNNRAPRLGNFDPKDEDCKGKIKELVCVVDLSGDGDPADRECQGDNEVYVRKFEKVYDRFPEVLQKMFCSLSKIYVEKDLDSTAYANPSMSAIGIRKSLLDEDLDLPTWATWKEQLSFGGSLKSYNVKNSLPSFSSDAAQNDFLYNVTAHEFGHLFDFANRLNALQGGVMKPGSYGALSWRDFSRALPEVDFPNRGNICFYDCGSHPLPASAIPALYEDLYTKSNFLNTYTSRNPREDFADTFGFYFTFKNLNDSYVLDTRQGASYDLRKEYFSERMRSKVEFIEKFLASNILYP